MNGHIPFAYFNSNENTVTIYAMLGKKGWRYEKKKVCFQFQCVTFHFHFIENSHVKYLITEQEQIHTKTMP